MTPSTPSGKSGAIPDRSLLEALPSYVLVQNGSRIVYANRAAREAIGIADTAKIDFPVSGVLLGAFPGLSYASGDQAFAGTEEYPAEKSDFECKLAIAGNRQVPIRGSYRVIHAPEPQLLISAMPISPEHSTFPHATFLEELLDSSPDAIAITHGTRVLHINPEFTRLFGYLPVDAIGKDLIDLILPETRLHEAKMLQHSVAQYGRASIESVRKTRSGELVDVSILVAPVVLHGEPVGYFSSFRDIREQKLFEAKLQYDALHDNLTGLANRALFVDRLTLMMARKQRHPDLSFAVMFLDLDYFKQINDKLGHASGDRVLFSVANRLKTCFRPQDTVARFGGDEFAVLLENVTSAADVKGIADRMQQELAQDIDVYGTIVNVKTSVGIAFGTMEHESVEQLLRDADLAMYRAKSAGGARHEIFDSSMHIHVAAQQQKERELRRAIEKMEFEVWYQPVYHLDSGEIEGFEALLRWRREDDSLVPLTDVLPLAEESGLIIPIGRFVLYEACKQAKLWLEGSPESNLTMSVNLSPRQFNQAELVDEIQSALAESGLPAGHLRLEIPEAAINQNPDRAIAVFQRLMDMGVAIALDNFGAGLASMNNLVRLPIDIVKIDRRLISYLPVPGRQSALLETLFDLGKALRVQMLAEGVENAGQLEALRERGCDLGQGYLFSPAVPGESAHSLAEMKHWNATPKVES